MPRSERLQPNRPSLGPLFAAAVAAWAGALLVEAASWRAYLGADGPLPVLSGSPGAAAGAAALVLAAALALLFSRRAGSRARAVCRAALPALVGLVCSLICSALFWSSWQTDVGRLQLALSESDGGVAAELVGDPVEREYGTVSVAEWRAGSRTLAFRVLWPEDAEPLSAGHRVTVSGSLSVPGDNVGGRWNHQQGYLGMVKAVEVGDAGQARGLRGLVCAFRDESFSRIEAAGPGGDAAGLLAGIVLGNRTAYAGTELEQDFRTTGLAHLMAVSGTHLAVVTALLTWALARTRLPRAPRGALAIGCLVLYVALTGFAPSAMRACVMCACATLAGLLKRRGNVVSALSLCALSFVCANPPLAFSLGFKLSVLAVLGLIALSPLGAAWLRRMLPGWLAGLADSAAATLSATLLTLPLTVPAFAQLPLVSPLATLLAAPLVTLALALGIPAVLAFALCEPLGKLLLGAALAVSGACAALVHALADLPLACVPVDSTGVLVGVLFAALAIALWAAWPLPVPEPPEGRRHVARRPAAHRPPARRPAARLSVVFCLLAPLAVALLDGFGGLATLQRAVSPPSAGDAQIVMVDVGQGDCMLVRDGSAALLVDTGEDGATLERGLARQGVAHLDAVVITHKDADHCGALSALTGVVGVDHVYVHADLLDDPAMAQVLEDARWVTAGRGAEGLSVGDRTMVGRFTLTLLAPERGGESGNDDSLVNLLEYDEDGDGAPEARGLLTGDAEAEATAQVAAGVGHVDFLKVAHHGSAGGATLSELEELSPQVALIGVGAGNRYGHPTEETLSLLERVRARVYRTDLDGDIRLSFSGTRMSVKLQRDG